MDDNILQILKKSNFAIFGAGCVGNAIFKILENFDLKPNCFIDDNIFKVKNTLQNIPIFHSLDAQQKFPNSIIIISAADIIDVIKQIEKNGWKNWIPGYKILNQYSINDCICDKNENINFIKYAIDTCIACQSNFLKSNKIFFRSIDIVITEKCSLKCKECSNLMQYYENPKTYTLEETFDSVERLLSIIDEVNELRIIGGEPLINKNCHLIIKKLNENPKVLNTIIYTNGTINIPDNQMENFKHTKTFFYITDYGEILSKNKSNLIKQLIRHGIKYNVNVVKNWTKCSKINKQNRNFNENSIIFEKCCAKNTTTLLDNILYRCPFSANATKLKAIPNIESDYINLKIKNIGEIRKKIKSWLFEKNFLNACDYCNGRSFDELETILPAEQIKIPLKYRKYE